MECGTTASLRAQSGGAAGPRSRHRALSGKKPERSLCILRRVSAVSLSVYAFAAPACRLLSEEPFVADAAGQTLRRVDGHGRLLVLRGFFSDPALVAFPVWHSSGSRTSVLSARRAVRSVQLYEANCRRAAIRLLGRYPAAG